MMFYNGRSFRFCFFSVSVTQTTLERKQTENRSLNMKESARCEDDLSCTKRNVFVNSVL